MVMMMIVVVADCRSCRGRSGPDKRDKDWLSSRRRRPVRVVGVGGERKEDGE